MLHRLVILLLLATPALAGPAVKDVARLAHQGESVLQGVGLVVGLPGTGDSAKELVVARPLAQVLRNNGIPIEDFSELRSARSVALVMVTCTTPAAGVRVNDRYDVTVSVINSAQSLAGGELYLAPLTGPFPGQPVFAIASGRIEIDDPRSPTRAKVRAGAQIVRPFPTEIVGDTVDLILRPAFAGWQSSAHIASRIRDEYLLAPAGMDDSLERIAEAIDDRTIRLFVPDAYRDNVTGFIADVMNTEFDAAQLKLPARVVVNRGSGAIVVTQEVEISLVAIAHKNLIIRRVTPQPVPSAQNPAVSTESIVGLGTQGRPSERARLDDLLDAFKQLSVPVDDQIQILQMLHRSGRLHAELIVD
ncbi:MAG: flagellar basal body P-ring protein FlgI [Phycisphaeraceae bacterium]|nr:flagellar basal body P-ring protein FlgI [Phycisphaeraceae bacterium]